MLRYTGAALLAALLLLIDRLPIWAADPPAGGPTAGSSNYGYQSTASSVTDWVLFIAIVVVFILIFYGLTRVIRGRSMRG